MAAALHQATQRLSRSQTARLDAEVLLAFALGWPRSRLLAHLDETIGQAELARYRELIERRAAGEPAAYIRNLKEFMGLDFYVDARVLIPRPETELLVDRARSWLTEHPSATVVDVGTGSGCIAISLAVMMKPSPTAVGEGMVRAPRLTGTDLSADALEVARRNASRHNVAIDFRLGSLLEPVPEGVDLVVANLPYLTEAEMGQLGGTSVDFEPPLALDGGPDGLLLFAELFAQADRAVKSGGAMLLEIGALQAEGVADLASRLLPGWRFDLARDLAGLPRVVELNRP